MVEEKEIRCSVCGRHVRDYIGKKCRKCYNQYYREYRKTHDKRYYKSRGKRRRGWGNSKVMIREREARKTTINFSELQRSSNIERDLTRILKDDLTLTPLQKGGSHSSSLHV